MFFFLIVNSLGYMGLTIFVKGTQSCPCDMGKAEKNMGTKILLGYNITLFTANKIAKNDFSSFDMLPTFKNRRSGLWDL